MTQNRHLIDSKWVFKKKIYVPYRARLVARGSTQITGVELSKKYSPEVTYITLCVILLMDIINK